MMVISWDFSLYTD